MAKNILVIDDDGMVTKSLCNLLHSDGYAADALNNGFDAIDKVQDTHFDLIVVDIRMPEINGVETVRKIKDALKSRHRPDVPVIFITGFADPELNKAAEGLGKVIFKPFDNRDLLSCIEEIVG